MQSVLQVFPTFVNGASSLLASVMHLSTAQKQLIYIFFNFLMPTAFFFHTKQSPKFEQQTELVLYHLASSIKTQAL